MPHKADQHTWEVIAQQISAETDSTKLKALATKLNEAMLTEAREQVKRRLGITA
jgi:hypothetical protein